MILGASAVFHRRNNPEIQERRSDNSEVPQLMKRLPQLNEKNGRCVSYIPIKLALFYMLT